MSKFKNMKLRYKIGVGVASAAAVAGMAGGAFAYFTSTGQGTGSASVGANTDWAVASTPDTSATLTPGGPAETISYTVTNNSSGHQQLNTVTIQVAGSTGTSPSATPTAWSYPSTANSNPSCTKGDFTVGTASAGDTFTIHPNVDLGPGDAYNGTVSVAMIDRTDTVAGDNSGNQDNCENQNPPLFIAAS